MEAESGSTLTWPDLSGLENVPLDTVSRCCSALLLPSLTTCPNSRLFKDEASLVRNQLILYGLDNSNKLLSNERSVHAIQLSMWIILSNSTTLS